MWPYKHRIIEQIKICRNKTCKMLYPSDVLFQKTLLRHHLRALPIPLSAPILLPMLVTVKVHLHPLCANRDMLAVPIPLSPPALGRPRPSIRDAFGTKITREYKKYKRTPNLLAKSCDKLLFG